MDISVRRAGPDDLQPVARLFDAYRRFYEQPADIDRALRFMGERLRQGDSVVLVAEAVAEQKGAVELAGFVQLYPAFSSVAARRLWILNDLYVDRRSRRRGVGEALMRAAAAWGRDQGALRLVLETMPDNTPAQALYERLGWRRGESFHYELDLD